MAQSYTRQSTFVDGDLITAQIFNDEYDQLVNAFGYTTSESSTGHRHDGTAGGGGSIPVIGDLDFNNKISVDSSNNRWGVFIEVGGDSVEQVRFEDGRIVPAQNNDIDLGTGAVSFKDLYLEGAANAANMDASVEITAPAIRVTGGTGTQGTLTWDDEETTLNLDLGVASFSLGADQHFYGKAIGAITKGQPVMFVGAQGNHILFSVADASAPGFIDEWIIGLAAQTLANNEYGFAVSSGKLKGLNTSSYAEGTILYLDTSTPGQLTATAPEAPAHQIIMAAVTRSHQNQGSLAVRVTNKAHLYDLYDVVITGPATNDLLVWNNTTGLWENKALSTLSITESQISDFGSYEPADATILKDADIGVTIQAYSAVLDATTASFTTADETKLDGIEAGATADQTGAEIKSLYEAESNTNAFTDAEKTKLSNIEANATADQTGAEIKSLYEAESDTNAFTDSEKSKLAGIEASATADQTGAEIKSLYEAEADTNAFTDDEKSKLAGIEASADVTDAANVAAAGAVMDSDFTSNGFMRRTGAGTYAVDGGSYQPLDSVLTNTTASFTTALETKLGGIETGATADQTAQEIVTLIDADATAESNLKTALGLGTAAYTAASAYATAAQGALADTALQSETDPIYTASSWYTTTNNSTNWNTAYTYSQVGHLPLAGGTLTGNLILNADPTAELGAATKQYVDTIAAASLHYHSPVRVESPIALTVTYNNGTAGVGATLTNAGTQAALVIDGITMNVNDRVLIYEQADSAQNGIYTVTNVGSGSTNWVLTRATDADSYGSSDPDSLGAGDAFFVTEGATGAGELYVMNTTGTITFGTTDITFAQISSAQIYTAGTGIDLTGVTISLNSATQTSLTNADTAYGWGDHASAGYAAASSLSNYLPLTGGTLTGDLALGDNDKAIFGAGSDLQIYHDGNNSRIYDVGTGDLRIQGTNLRLMSANGANYLYAVQDAYTKLYYNGAEKLATTSTGIDVTGTVTATGGNSTNWNTAYSWGNHASAGYLTSIASNLIGADELNVAGNGTAGYALTSDGDGSFSWTALASGGLGNIVEDTTPQLGGTLDANGQNIDMGVNLITDTKVGQWDTAYGWGNHASAGYLATSSYTASDVLTKIKTVDGSGSGLDADLLDGIQGSGYVNTSSAQFVGGSKTFNSETKFGSSYVDPDSGVARDAKFGTNGIAVSGGIKTDTLTISSTYPTIKFTDTDNNPDWTIIGASGRVGFYDETNTIERVTISGFGLDVIGAVTATGGSSVDWNAAYSWGNHASAGYITGNQTITLSGDVSGSGTTSINVTVANDSHSHSNYLPKANNSDYQLKVWDNRNTNTSTDLGSEAAVFEFKANATDSLSDGGSYHGVLTLQPWGDPSGGNTHQLAFTDNGNLHLRSVSIGGTWPTNWSKLWHSNNDGSGSGLDADTVDGIHASAFLLSSNNLSDLGSSSTARSNLGLGSLATLSSVGAAQITDNSVGAAELNVSGNGSTNQFLRSDGDGSFNWYTLPSYLTGNQTITLSGDLSGSGTTSINAQLVSNCVGANELNVSGNGSNGQVLSSDGDGSMTWITPAAGGGGGIEYIRKTTTYTALVGEGIIADTGGGSWTLTLPASPSIGDIVVVVDGNDWGTNNLTVARNGSTIDDVAQDMLLDVSSVSVEFIYDGTTWHTYVSAGEAGILNVVEDTSPQLGGNLETNGYGIYLADNNRLYVGTGGGESSIYSNGTATYWDTASTAKDIYFRGSTTSKFWMDMGTGDFHADGDVVAASTSISDRRLKDNIVNIGNALDKVQQLNGVDYTWKKDGKADTGLIAQEVQAVLPNIVKEVKQIDGEECLAITYAGVIGLLVEAVKELKAEVDELKGAK